MATLYRPTGFVSIVRSDPFHAVTDASMHDSQMLAPLVAPTHGAVYADSAYRSAEAEAMLAQKQPRKLSGERAYRNRPLTDEQKESNRQKSKIRARIEHIFGYMSQSIKDSPCATLGGGATRRPLA